MFAPHLITFGNKKWQVRVEEVQRRLQNKKKIFHDLLKNKICILANKFTPGGRGSSNDGNTVRRIFKVYRESARIRTKILSSDFM
jgi:hypothetical protein